MKTWESHAALRDGFGQGLLEAGKNKKIYALCADLTQSDRMNWFAKKYPERFVEVGVAEQNLVGVSAGLARIGKIPFAGSFAVFSPGRSWDQVRVSCCYSNHNVKLYGGHAGISVGEDGATHQALEDIAITRCLPNMTVIVPCDAEEMRKATLAAASLPGTVYLRGGRPKIPLITKTTDTFEIGKANVLRRGEHVTIVACGIMVEKALRAAEQLAMSGVHAEVINMHTIKPLDEQALLRSAKKTDHVVTAEEHQIIGGLGSAVAESLAKKHPVRIECVGVHDTFGESGTYEDLIKKYGLDTKDIVRAVKKVLR